MSRQSLVITEGAAAVDARPGQVSGYHPTPGDELSIAVKTGPATAAEVGFKVVLQVTLVAKPLGANLTLKCKECKFVLSSVPFHFTWTMRLPLDLPFACF